jgi:hypothetical protein
VEGIELPSTLALLLRSDLRSARDRRFEDRLELGPSGDLAANVADDPTEPAAQQPEPDLASQRARPGSKLQFMGLHPLRRSRRFSG